MRLKLIIPALLACTLMHAEGRRTEAGDAFLEPLQKRDSVLVADQLRYGAVLPGIPEGTLLALPDFKPEKESPLEIVGGWQLDSTRVSGRKETPARYDIKVSMVLTAFMGGTYELPDIPVLVGTDTLVFRAPDPLVVTEPQVDMENFEPNDIKPQVKFPYTFGEIFPWVLGALALAALVWLLVRWIRRRHKAVIDKENAEPAHIRALRKLDAFRSDKFWAPEKQKAFYSGVTDALREYIAARFGIGAMEMTTAEIFEGLKDADDLPEDLYAEMKDLFERADFVKFAKFAASDEENAKVLPGAVRFVTTTYQQELAAQAGNDDAKVGRDVVPVSDRASQKQEE